MRQWTVNFPFSVFIFLGQNGTFGKCKKLIINLYKGKRNFPLCHKMSHRFPLWLWCSIAYNFNTLSWIAILCHKYSLLIWHFQIYILMCCCWQVELGGRFREPRSMVQACDSYFRRSGHRPPQGPFDSSGQAVDKSTPNYYFFIL